jgi:hypothetical protein
MEHDNIFDIDDDIEETAEINQDGAAESKGENLDAKASDDESQLSRGARRKRASGIARGGNNEMAKENTKQVSKVGESTKERKGQGKRSLAKSAATLQEVEDVTPPKKQRGRPKKEVNVQCGAERETSEDKKGKVSAKQCCGSETIFFIRIPFSSEFWIRIWSRILFDLQKVPDPTQTFTLSQCQDFKSFFYWHFKVSFSIKM